MRGRASKELDWQRVHPWRSNACRQEGSLQRSSGFAVCKRLSSSASSSDQRESLMRFTPRVHPWRSNACRQEDLSQLLSDFRISKSSSASSSDQLNSLIRITPRPTDTNEPEDQQSLQMQQRQVTDCKNNQFHGPGGNVDVELIDKSLNRHSVHFPTAGWYLWPATGLGFGVREAVTVTISFESWGQHLDLALQQDEHWMVAGPLFDITAEPEGAIAKIQLPHFISLQGGEVDISWFQVAHFKNEGMVLEQPTRVEPFYAVLENPSFSLMGILLLIASGTRLSVPVTSTTLILDPHHPHPQDIKFHLYLIPSDNTLTKAIDEEEDRFHGVRLQNSPPVEPLNFGSRYIVSGCAHLEIVPKELKLSYRSPGEIQPFSKIYAGQMKEPIQLKITDKRLGSLTWETFVKPVDIQLGAASAPPTFSGAAFVREHHRQLRDRMGDLSGVLDDLQDSEILTKNERELVEQAQTQQRKNETLLRMVENKGERALELFYSSLQERDPYLVHSLR
ncbi:LOW QUALITY PROTEIN: caspase recruitment domain-containing protein 8-like [Elephas maximus indicus]|uniref:LOW QUALITY PROTEIN: caspase recruitment domain-containing protein 8-like n=1 Tax=Elephas maximus indicus TaxID=99487 RepID=UPI00211646F3|nr:LOW QUALITY PROTEIN: caspase recruitment domain-containing protein 8-like [Elephas maximus indicus]